MNAWLCGLTLFFGLWLLSVPTLCGVIGVPVRLRHGRLRVLAGCALLVIGATLLANVANAHADSGMAVVPRVLKAPRIRVPEASATYRRMIEQAAAETWGVNASVARVAAQIHQESRWNPKAHSPVGAQGLAQFMPATGRWLARKFPQLGAYDPWDPGWSARAVVAYDDWLHSRADGDTACARWAFTLSAYNGGETRLRREKAQAARAGRDGRKWFANAADYRARSVAAWRENRGYVRRILMVLEPAYIDDGWDGQAVCHV